MDQGDCFLNSLMKALSGLYGHSIVYSFLPKNQENATLFSSKHIAINFISAGPRGAVAGARGAQRKNDSLST
jgi:hypothetical protein